MISDDRGSAYDVGFGEPPKHGRFRKGVSGNPKGRPKGQRNLATILARTLREKVVINENGVRRTVSKLEAAVKQLVNKAATGDLVALRQLAALARSTEDQQSTPENKQLADEDQKVLAGVLKRIENSKGESDGDHETGIPSTPAE
jgi:Family of unknown function (DUF5681)